MAPHSAIREDDLAALLDRVRSDAPLVQCLTNAVVTNFTANALLALGASPAMVDIPDEAGPFATISSGVLINLGTPRAEQREAMIEAALAARGAGTPWVLDPVAVGVLPVRTELNRQLLELGPTVVRGNASEIAATAGSGSGGRGTDSTASATDVAEVARGLAAERGCVVAVSGPTDVLTDGEREFRLDNGTPLLTKVTGGGCALGAVIAAFLAVDDDRLLATAAAVGSYTVAAERAAESASGPGSFAAGFLDSLAGLDSATLAARLRLSGSGLGEVGLGEVGLGEVGLGEVGDE